MRTEDRRPVAVLSADWHGSLRVPPARAETPQEWKDSQAGYYKQVADLAKRFGSVPILVAGDLTDRWDLTPEEINFMIDAMPHVRAVPGNHDLPNHSYAEVERSAYWTLVQAGKVTNVKPGGQTYLRQGWHAVGFPHGVELKPPVRMGVDDNYLAVVHSYIWCADHKYEGAPGDANVHEWQDDGRFRGYDAALFGDNHHQFQMRPLPNRPPLLNAGCLVRRRSDERNLVPVVGVLYADARIERVPLDTSKDKWLDAPEQKVLDEVGLDADELLGVLRQGADAALDYEEAVRRYVNVRKVTAAVARAALACLPRKEKL